MPIVSIMTKHEVAVQGDLQWRLQRRSLEETGIDRYNHLSVREREDTMVLGLGM